MHITWDTYCYLNIVFACKKGSCNTIRAEKASKQRIQQRVLDNIKKSADFPKLIDIQVFCWNYR